MLMHLAAVWQHLYNNLEATALVYTHSRYDVRENFVLPLILLGAIVLV